MHMKSSEPIPALSSLEALRRNMIYTMFNSVTPEDMQALVAAQVEKGKQGDTKAFREIKDMFLASQQATANVNVRNSFNVEGGVIDAIVKIRERMSREGQCSRRRVSEPSAAA
jgi:hypothetical protein